MIEKSVLAGVAILLVAAIIFVVVRRRRPVQLNTEQFSAEWKELQKKLRSKEQWGQAVVAADNLLDAALKKKRIGGRSMGERLVKAQRLFTDNDGVWFGHKLRGQIDHNPEFKLKEGDVKQALFGLRQGLKDVGALPQ